MNYTDPHQTGSETEQQLRQQVDDLKRQLREQKEGHAAPPPKRWRPSAITIIALLLGLVVLFAGAFVAGYIPLQRREALVRAESQERGKDLPRMEVMRVGRSSIQSSLRLPGTLQAVTEAPILARADGYLKTRYVDLGDRVRAGQPLAEIDAPELDQQIRQAEAAVAQAQASLEQAQASLEQGKSNRDLARVTAERWKTLVAQGVVSQQENDQYQAQLTSQNANVQALEKAVLAQRSNVAASQANVARLQEVQGYRVVKAPFDGVITVRNVDVGALVNTGSTLLFRIAQTGTLRSYVNVPQANAGSVHVGQTAQLTLTNFPGRRFPGTVARTANALDPSSRTMLVEVAVPNADGALFPGMYAEVDLSGARSNPPLLIPALALIVRADGAQVAVVENDVIHLQKVVIGRDYGDRVEIVQGVTEGTTILAAPGDAAQEGAKIVPVRSDSVQP
ncbi:MAG TPA: efflux RND transporter periplasmic adaptor subunit [Bryobacteraceae bacterium]|nr:efflux RND transporter periplasmic adaptor subunit [Bryobacteraceae bacterium]